jgi:hypothetical protein
MYKKKRKRKKKETVVAPPSDRRTDVFSLSPVLNLSFQPFLFFFPVERG